MARFFILLATLASAAMVVACTPSGSGTSATAGNTPTGGNPTARPATVASAPSPSPAIAGVASPSPAAAGGATTTVMMTDANQFQPATITISRGSSVTWMNGSQTPHSSTADASKAAKASDAVLPSGAQPWDSGILNPGQSFSHTFDTPGTYMYFCIPHESLGMLAKITVT